jgi:sulfoxide reductase heme-binding subunit YedZ
MPSSQVLDRRPSTTPDPWLKPGLFIGALAPPASIALRVLTGSLSANPIAEVENELGLAALIFLIASLACTPARRVFGWTWPARIRRELGLFAFAYATLHVSVYVFLDQALDVRAMFDDVVKRPFITMGFSALVLLVPLAVTSTRSSIRRLGFVRWRRLHQLAYVAGVLAAIHFIWRVKIDVSQPLTYAAVVCMLLLVRVLFWVASHRTPSAASRRQKGRSVPA